MDNGTFAIYIVGAIAYGTLLGFVLGKIIGQFTERKAWNKLIDEGKIPKPTSLRSQGL